PQPAESGGLVLHLSFRRGTVGVLTLATFARPEPRVELELSGEGWSLGFGDELASLRVEEADKTTILKRANRPAEEQVSLCLDAVAAGDPAKVPTGYADALMTLSVCHAAAVSAREGRPVELEPLAEQTGDGDPAA